MERTLTHVEELEADIQAVSERIEEKIPPFERALELLDTIPGVDGRAGEVIAPRRALRRAASRPRRLASWAGVCPGQNESAGKRKPGKTRKGSKWLRMTLTESARAAIRSNGIRLQQRYRQLARRRDDRQESVHRDRTRSSRAAGSCSAPTSPTKTPGPKQREHQEIERVRRRAIRQLEALGDKLILETLPEAA